MIELIRSVEELAQEEHTRANKEHDEYFNSGNEALGVILEEIEEASDEAVDAAKAFDKFKQAVYADDIEWQSDSASDVYSAAVRAAAEFIQVAAMAKKAIASNKEVEHE